MTPPKKADPINPEFAYIKFIKKTLFLSCPVLPSVKPQKTSG